MKPTTQIAKLLRDVHFGGNWTYSNLKDHLSDVSWRQAVTKVHSFNTIATLVNHMNYYVSGVSEVLEGKPLTIKDKFSFVYPPIQSQEDWERMLEKTWRDAETFAGLIEQMPEEQLWENFDDGKYGNYYRNLHGIIEHCHYHLGQIVLIKKILVEEA